MNKRLLLIIVVVLLLATVLFVFFVRGSNESEGNVSEEGALVGKSPTAEIVDDKWNRIEFPAEGVSIKVPQKWNTYLYDTLSSGIVSEYNTSQVTLNFYLNYDEREHASNIKTYVESYGYSATYEGGGAHQIVKYVGLVPVETVYQIGDGDISAKELAELQNLLKNSYVVGQLIPIKEGSLVAHCQVRGEGYAGFIDDCNDIMKSLTIK